MHRDPEAPRTQNRHVRVARPLRRGTAPIRVKGSAMTMTQTRLQLTELDLDVWPDLPLPVGAGFVDPRLVAPRCDNPDVEDLIAFRTSTISS